MSYSGYYYSQVKLSCLNVFIVLHLFWTRNLFMLCIPRWTEMCWSLSCLQKGTWYFKLFWFVRTPRSSKRQNLSNLPNCWSHLFMSSLAKTYNVDTNPLLKQVKCMAIKQVTNRSPSHLNGYNQTAEHNSVAIPKEYKRPHDDFRSTDSRVWNTLQDSTIHSGSESDNNNYY